MGQSYNANDASVVSQRGDIDRYLTTAERNTQIHGLCVI